MEERKERGTNKRMGREEERNEGKETQEREGFNLVLVLALPLNSG